MKTRPHHNAPSRPRLPAVCVHLVLTATLVLGLLVAATAVGMGIARAEDLNAIVRPDTGLMIGLMLVAIAVMCALSAAAVHFGNRSRD